MTKTKRVWMWRRHEVIAVDTEWYASLIHPMLSGDFEDRLDGEQGGSYWGGGPSSRQVSSIAPGSAMYHVHRRRRVGRRRSTNTTLRKAQAYLGPAG